MNERKSIVRKIGITFATVVGIFIAINLVWFIGSKVPYLKLTSELEKIIVEDEEINKISYEKKEDGYSFFVKDTVYLSNSGFARVGKEEGLVWETDKNGNILSDNGTYVVLYIWPKMFSGYKFGVDIENVNEWYQISVDENGQYIVDENVDPELQEEEKKVLEENREEIDRLFNLADDMWDIR